MSIALASGLIDEPAELFQVLLGELLMFQEELHHGSQRSVKCSLHRLEYFAASGLPLADVGSEKLQVTDFLDLKKALIDHPVHRGFDGAVSAVFAHRQRLLDGACCTWLLLPDDLYNVPFGFGEFYSVLFRIDC